MNIREKHSVAVTQGMANASRNIAKQCAECGLKVPLYPGRYPVSCPNCGTAFEPLTMDEAIDLIDAGMDVEAVGELNEGLKDKWKKLKQAAGEGKKATKRKKARKRAKTVSRLKTKEKKAAAKAEKKAGTKAGTRAAKQAQKARAKRSKVTQKAKAGLEKERKRKAAAQRKARRAGQRKTESVMESYSPHALRNTMDVLREQIGRSIARDGHANLDEIARKLGANPIAVYNLVKTRQDEWGLVIGGTGYRAYPRTAGSRLNG